MRLAIRSHDKVDSFSHRSYLIAMFPRPGIRRFPASPRRARGGQGHEQMQMQMQTQSRCTIKPDTHLVTTRIDLTFSLPISSSLSWAGWESSREIHLTGRERERDRRGYGEWMAARGNVSQERGKKKGLYCTWRSGQAVEGGFCDPGRKKVGVVASSSDEAVH